MIKLVIRVSSRALLGIRWPPRDHQNLNFAYQPPAAEAILAKQFSLVANSLQHPFAIRQMATTNGTEAESPDGGGVVLFCGGTDWALVSNVSLRNTLRPQAHTKNTPCE